MVYPESVIEAIKAAANEHKGDIPEAIAAACAAVRALPDFPAFRESLVDGAIQELVYQVRGASNHAMKVQAGVYGAPAKVLVGRSEELRKVYDDLRDYRIGCQTLGLLFGRDLMPIAEMEGAKARGHEFNRRLVEELARIVPDEKRVRDVVSKRQMVEVFSRAKLPATRKHQQAQ